MNREWVDVAGYEGLYKISTDGMVESAKRITQQGKNMPSIMMKQRLDKDGYCVIALCKAGKYKTHKVHRLVAAAFKSNNEDKPQVNHINETKNDNRISNLEWVTASENSRYGTLPERISKRMTGRKVSMETRKKMSKIAKNRKMSNETKQKISKALISNTKIIRKLKKSDVVNIKKMFRNADINISEVARAYGVSVSTIWGICHNKKWKHVKIDNEGELG